jgi:hypothetical protein
MTGFNYEKAYCVQALPAFLSLNKRQREVHEKLRPLVKDLHQEKVSLSIPLSDEMKSIMEDLTCQELAELSRASYFVGHWKPSLMPDVFDNQLGKSWKIANVIDQILRLRLGTHYKIQVHEGKLRVTYSSIDCWLWEEFGLATEKNLNLFKNCGLEFSESTLNENAKKLTEMCGDLWPDVDTMPNNEAYENLLIIKKEKALETLKEQHAQKLLDIEKDIENSKIELSAFKWLISHDVPINNCIYYSHTGKFSFGWRERILDVEKADLIQKLGEFPYDWEFSKNKT